MEISEISVGRGNCVDSAVGEGGRVVRTKGGSTERLNIADWINK